MTVEKQSSGSSLMLFPLPEERPVSERPATFLANVDQLLWKLWGIQDFRKYLDAVTNRSAITGKFEIDRGFAAKRIQEEASRAKLTDVASAKLTKIMRAIETILRRDHLSRKQRLAALNAPKAAE